MRNFRLVVDEQVDVVSIALIGELDMAEVDTFERELQRIEETPPATLVLDLSELVLIDSHGLSALLDAETRAQHCDSEDLHDLVRRWHEHKPPACPDQRFSWLDSETPSPGLELTDAVGRLRRRVASPAD